MPDLYVLFVGLGVVCFLIWLFTIYRKGQTDPIKKAQELHERSNIHQPAIISKLQAGRYKASAEAVDAKVAAIEAHTRLAHQDTQAQIADMASTHEVLETPARLERQGELESLQHRITTETTKTNLGLVHKAGERGFTLETDQQVRFKEAESQIKTKEAEEMAQIEIKKSREMKGDELQNTLEEMRERVRLAIIADYLTEHQKIQLILEQADMLYQQIQGIEENKNLSERTKRRMINDREEFLLTLKEDRRGREDRLLQAGNRQGHKQVGQDTNLRGDYRQATEAGEE